MILSEQLPVQPGDVITTGSAAVTVTTILPNENEDGSIVFYTVGRGSSEWHFQLPAPEFERRILSAPNAVLTRADAGGVEG